MGVCLCVGMWGVVGRVSGYVYVWWGACVCDVFVLGVVCDLGERICVTV